MKASSKRNHFDVGASKCRPDRHHCVGHYRSPVACRTLTTAYHFVVNLQQIATQRDREPSKIRTVYIGLSTRDTAGLRSQIFTLPIVSVLFPIRPLFGGSTVLYNTFLPQLDLVTSFNYSSLLHSKHLSQFQVYYI